MKQKEVFLKSEGDAWFYRNCNVSIARRFIEKDPLCISLKDILSPLADDPSVSHSCMDLLEIGCGDGFRLAWLQKHFDVTAQGIEPSQAAVKAAKQNGILAQQGTADRLPFEDSTFDIVVFGFCLYLCDRSDLFSIAKEADRVLKTPGWLLIYDFYSPVPVARDYEHVSGLKSYKMD